jgi:hypothetical protein
MIKGSVMFSGNDRQPCFADYKAKLYHDSHIQHVAILISEHSTSNSTFITHNDFTTYTAVRAVLQQLGYGVRYDFIKVYYLAPRSEFIGETEPLISTIPLEWKPSKSDFNQPTFIEKVVGFFTGKRTVIAKKASYHILSGQDDFVCGEYYYAGKDFEADEREEKYKELCDFFEL